MADKQIPADAPPSYDQVTGGSASSRPHAGNAHLDVPGKSKSGIPTEVRRSMEDLQRPLPDGWVRTFDPETEHQFFVDTTKDPPRSTWVHPYDDDVYLGSLSGEQRERIEQESLGRRQPSKADIMYEHTDDEDEDHHYPASKTGELPPRPQAGKGKGKESLGRRLKDKVTSSTHEEREAERRRRAEEEREAYERHMLIRQAMSKAMRTGQPQLIGKDRNGKEVYVEPPQYGGGGYPGAGGYGGGGYGYSPYGSGSGMYASPNARYLRPSAPYGRPYGMGYGGGYGMPLALGGGLMGGMLLGGALGGF